MSARGRVVVVTALLTLASCTPPRRSEPRPPPIVDARVRTDARTVDVAPLPTIDLAPAVDGGSTCDCPAFTDCRIVRRRALAGQVAQELGLRLVGGAFQCAPDVVGCSRPLPAASGAEVWELTAGCGFWTERLLVIGRDVYHWQPMSVGERGGPGWSLARMRVEDPRSLRPLGMHFLADARRVYRDGPVAGADVATFRVLACPVETTRCLARDRAADYYEGDRGWSVERVPR